ncbi:hypothetical protein FGADI_8119 [Fusarium gaditjirri]|uniref:Ankyrin repeat protein n=1 Tax=Fusarium gaditjirri TaxID=282569 RepID=A0A8H4T3F3_9HYPO|nr:hypothetical protein FGADI_8119 [Fusarium gaditjirri]
MSTQPRNQRPVPKDEDFIVFEEPFKSDEESNDVSAVDVIVIYAIYEDKDPMSLFSQVLQNPLLDSGSENPAGSAKTKHEIIQQDSRNKPKNEDGGTPPPKSCNWLREKGMLRSALPAIGILSCGLKMAQNTSVDFRSVSSTICTKAESWRAQRRRPIIWIAHGYGTRTVPHLFGPDNSASDLISTTAAIILFAAPTDASKACLLREWTCNKLDIPPESKNAFFEDKLSPSSINIPELVTWSKKYDMALLSVVDGEHSEASKGHDETNQKNVLTKPDDTKQKEKANVSRDREHTSGTQSDQTQAQVDRFIDYIPVKKGAFGDTAKFRGREDRTFVYICNKLQNAAKTHQILSAARRGAQVDMERLINKGINVRLSNSRGESALHIACRSQSQSIVQYLVGISQIDLRQPDHNGMTALHIAAQRLDESGPEVVRVLLQAGANWTVRNNNNHTPLDLVSATLDKDSQPAAELTNREKIIGLLNNPPPVRREFANRGMTIAEREDELKEACENTLMTVRELNFAPGRDMFRLVKYATVEEVIYRHRHVDELMNDLFKKHPPNGQGTNQICRWFHIPVNNMAWVHVCLTFLGKEDCRLVTRTSLSDSVYKSGPGHRVSETMGVLKVFPKLGEKNNACAFMMPYISFGNSENQGIAEEVMDSLIARNSPFHRLSFSQRHQRGLRYRAIRLFFEEMVDTDPNKIPRKYFNSFRNRLADAGFWPRMRDRAYSEDEDLTSMANKGLWNYLFYAHPESLEDLPLHPRRHTTTCFRTHPIEIGAKFIHAGLQSSGYRVDSIANGILNILFEVADSEDDLSDFEKYYTLGENSSRRAGGDILMVDQLWLWLIPGNKEGDKSSPDTLITSFPSPDEPQPPLDERILNDPSRSKCISTRELVKCLLNGCSQTLRQGQRERSLNAMEAFEKAVGNAEEKEAQLFQVFNILSGLLSDLDDEDRLYPQFQKRYLGYLDILRETQLLTEVKDILDEIKMIEQVVESQKQVLCEYDKDREGRDGDDDHRYDLGVRSELISPLLRVQEGFRNMKERAKAIESSIERLLDLKQKQANTWEARIAREGALETAKQGSLPLSFMASFLALDVDQFPQDPESQETNWPLARVCALICKQKPVALSSEPY